MQVQCENCLEIHEGTYASGRFCSGKCARGFSSKAKRAEINRKVSEKLKGRPGPVISAEVRQKQGKALSESQWKILMESDFASLSLERKRKRVIKEQGSNCLKCGIHDWQGSRLVLQLDHIDGDTSNNIRENLRGLCPNCHSQTETFCGKRNKTGKTWARVLDAHLLAVLLSSPSIGQALTKVGLSWAGPNFDRCKLLLKSHNSSYVPE